MGGGRTLSRGADLRISAGAHTDTVSSTLRPLTSLGPTALVAIGRSDRLLVRTEGTVNMPGHRPWKRIRGDVERDRARRRVDVARREAEVEQGAYRSSV